MTLTHIDHLIFATFDLEAAIGEFAALLGVRPVFGGQHLGLGTHNALLSLGSHCYLEIIAPDPNQPTPPRPRSFGIDTLDKPRLVTWAAGTDRISLQAAASVKAGYDPGQIIDGGRKKPDGTQLRWQSTKRPEALNGQPLPAGGLLPFLISWGDTPHPSTQTPTGCSLVSLRAEHPNPSSVIAQLDALQTPLSVTQGDTVQLIALLDTPAGQVELR